MTEGRARLATDRVTAGAVTVDDPTFMTLPASVSDRAVPAHTQESEAFWQGLREDRLIFARCNTCTRYSHYPVAGCTWCGSPDQRYEEVSPSGSVYSYTVCSLPFGPGLSAPYVVAAIEPECQPGIKLITNIVNCRINQLHIGLPVSGVFFHEEPHHLLFFEPRQPSLRGTADTLGGSDDAG
jgi:uncharacterized OB-fold protein